MKIYLCTYGSSAAVIAAKGIGDARTGFLAAIDTSKYLTGVDRKQIRCREVRHARLVDGIGEDAAPLLMQKS